MRRIPPVPLLLLALPAAAAELPVRAVVLSSAGLAQVERAGPLAPDATVTLRAPTEDVDDVLKSLLLRDAAPGARVEGVRLPAQDPAEEAFRGLPLAPADFESRVALLRALRGQAVDPRGARGRLLVDLPRRPGFTPRFAVAAEGDFGLRHEAALDGAPATLRFAWEREGRTEIPLWDPGLGDPLLLRWREVDLDREARRLPGGPGTLETLGAVLERLPADAPGRAGLEGVVAGLAEARRLLDAARAAIRGTAVAEEALRRARAAAEDRTGPEREEARRRLNAASLAAEREGAAADAAWEAWQRAVQDVVARTG